MKADLSRSTFNPSRHYRDVRLQQGRVQLDADFNEYTDLVHHRIEAETVDVVGDSGGPAHVAGFLLASATTDLPADQQAGASALGGLQKGDFYISGGRYYVEGFLCENGTAIRYASQDDGDLPGSAPLTAPGLYLAYLDVWPRLVTALDDPHLREVALGGPDTTARNKTVWQVRLLAVGTTGTAPDCEGAYAAYTAATSPSSGTLSARAQPDAGAPKPCVLPPGGGYRRLENQLYRCEIHQAGNADGTATFKWSRDNGSVVSTWDATPNPKVIRLKQPPRDKALGFAIGMSVEITDDSNELLGTPGAWRKVTDFKLDLLTLDQDVPGTFTRNPKVRRWDGIGESPVTTGSWIALEDGIQIKFGSGTYHTGDYWTIPARTATSDVDWPKDGVTPAFLAPAGIRHHYARLGFIDFNGTAIQTHDCRRIFYPLTELQPGGDLKLHNKHLHGSGVVCGLQVHCAGGDGSTVRIEPGHAIDCSGADILLKSPTPFAAVSRARALSFLDGHGDGSALLTVTGDTHDQPVFDLQAVSVEDTSTAGILKTLLEGTLWWDFYHDCLKPLADYVESIVVKADPTDKNLVPLAQRRALTVLNLVSQLSNTDNFHRLWLSQVEHDWLAKIYADLQSFAKGSRTSCSLADSFTPFPAYPFAGLKIRTTFIGHSLDSIRVSKDGSQAWAFGSAAPGQVFLLDLVKGELIAAISVAGASGLPIQDVAMVTRSGKPAVMVVSSPGDNSRTVLSFLAPNDHSAVGDPVTLTGATLSRVVSLDAAPNRILAVQKQHGVHILDTEKLATSSLPAPRWSFAAAGHLVIAGDSVCATVAGSNANAYAALRFGRVMPVDDNLGSTDIPLSQFLSGVTTGSDDIALGNINGQPFLHVVVDPLPGRTVKSVLVIDLRKVGFFSLLDLPANGDAGTPTGPVALGPSSAGDYILIALADRNELLWAPANASVLPLSHTLPTQNSPQGIAVAAGSLPQVLAVNANSQTITLIPTGLLGSTPATEAQINAYRTSLVAAFESLIIPLIQELKDCLCDHLLSDCPTCGPNESLTLAKLSFKNGKVDHICNFERREVWTFPKIRYWLSAIPLLPLVAWAVEQFCCWMLPMATSNDPSNGTDSASQASSSSSSNLNARSLFSTGVQFLANPSRQQLVADNFKRTQVLGSNLSKLARPQLGRIFSTQVSTTRPSDVIGSKPSDVQQQLANRGIQVNQVSEYDPRVAASVNAFSPDAVPLDLRPGEKVNLYTSGGKVAYYTRTPTDQTIVAVPSGGVAPVVAGVVTSTSVSGTSTLTAGTSPTPPETRAMQADLAALKTQIAQMQAAHAEGLASRDRTIAELQAAVATLKVPTQRAPGI